ncbi:MAG TPA: sugar phosphate isomerase/epimerase family protein [Pirellulales bacterium]
MAADLLAAGRFSLRSDAGEASSERDGEGTTEVGPTKIGLHLHSLRRPLKPALEAAHRLKVAAIEVDARNDLKPSELTQTGFRQLKKQLDDLRLTVCSVGFQTRRGYFTQDGLDARVKATKAAMDMAYQLGCNFVVNQVGQIPPADSKDWALLVEVLTDLAHYANRAGAWLAARTGSESGADLKRLVEALPTGGIFVSLDPGALVMNKFSVEEVIEQVGLSIVHVYANDGVRDTSRGRGMQVALGKGMVDFPQVMGMLAERDYRGWYVVEREQSETPEEELAQSIRYLQNVAKDG